LKVLKIHKNGRQIETLVLHRPTHLIGRSPHCDLVLRAKDVLSIHFIAEWLGTGDFDPEVGEWTLFSTKSTGEKNHEAYNKRGVVLGSKMSSLDGFEFSLDADSLNQAPEIGGHYKRGLTEAHNRGASDPSQELCLEVSQVHAATGSIESVQHFSYESKYASKFRPLSEMPQVSIKWKAFRAAHDFDFSSLKDSEIFFGNDPLPPPQRQKLSLAPYQIVIAKLNNKDVYFRLVTKSKPVPIQKVFFEDRTMRKLFLALFIPLLVIFSALFLIEPFEKEPEPEKTPSRVVRIEAPPPAPTPVAAEMPSTPAEPTLNQGPAIEADQRPSHSVRGDMPKSNLKPEVSVPTVSINRPLPKKAVSQLGILGALGQAPRGKGVRAEEISDDASSLPPSASNRGIQIKSTPNGVLGTGSFGDPNSHARQGLASAGTQLRGGDYDPKSTSPIGGGSGTRGARIGTLTGTATSGVPSFNISGSGSVAVEGGLDRETVRRIVRSYQGEIQTCYERGLVKEPTLGGRFVIDWTIQAPGMVSKARMTTEQSRSPAFVACLLGVVRGMVFPKAKNGMPTRVIYPFEFKTAN
jgi:hypothetical protein